MRCVGYRQVWEALDAHEAKGSSGPLPLADVRELGIIASRQLAKRQITWLRSMPQRHIVAADQADALDAVRAHVKRVLPAKD
jgi:tRNA dimethylallyltransferase